MHSDGARSSGSTGHPTAGSSSAPSMPTSRGSTRCPASRPSRVCAAVDLEAALAARFAASPAAEWVSRLTAAGIGAQPVISATQLMQDPWVVAHGLSVTREHGSGERITTIGPPARLSRTPVIPGRPVSAPGGDAAEILAGIGLANQLDDLVARRIVALE